MPTFNAGNGAFTPSTTNDNWTLDAVGTGVFGKVISIGWGGSLTTSTGYRTRWVRPTTAGTGTKTALTIGYNQPNYIAAAFTATSTYGTAQPVLPTDPAGNLHAQNWNAQGGVGMIVMPLANPWWVSTGRLRAQRLWIGPPWPQRSQLGDKVLAKVSLPPRADPLSHLKQRPLWRGTVGNAWDEAADALCFPRDSWMPGRSTDACG